MTLKEETIINIAIRAGALLQTGEIEADERTGHMGMTTAIVQLAEQFEKENAGVNYDEEDRDYWLEVDAFAETNLHRLFGQEKAVSLSPPEIKQSLASRIDSAEAKAGQAAEINKRSGPVSER